MGLFQQSLHLALLRLQWSLLLLRLQDRRFVCGGCGSVQLLAYGRQMGLLLFPLNCVLLLVALLEHDVFHELFGTEGLGLRMLI